MNAPANLRQFALSPAQVNILEACRSQLSAFIGPDDVLGTQIIGMADAALTKAAA